MRFRRLSAIAVSAVAALTLAACGGGGESSSGGGAEPAAASDFPEGSTMARLAQQGSITIGTKFDQPGFGLQGLDGKPAGFDVEIAKYVASKLGISEDNIEWVETPSQVREEVIEQGRVDMVVATYTINDERKQRVTFAGPYYEAGQALMVRSDDTTVTGPDSLRAAGTRVCSVAGSTPSQEILNYVDESQLTLFDVYSKCADALRTNQVDAVTTDNVILLGFVADSDGAFKLAGDTFTKEPYGIGIKKGDVAFCEFINQALQEAQSSGAYAEAWESTAGQIAEVTTPSLPELEPCA
ncbi:MAG TPA: glutamate ABC transporter substrate-binding protein [Pseudonocardia sp.]|jgi:glutamate transport system substrate-binding protein|uniref:glutamate ABC transporter substrate-binding protein n=1 Tax=Pseudonocardia sp. TaxID=60912 RepID=UPI002B4B3F8F|nr:glutamate ABC transporter substrate-binding protein [Pseudonocardia sp.]HLU60402.1 glutamate ABC transporter substrate-binding protein [Pseudonocardia sp.]